MEGHSTSDISFLFSSFYSSPLALHLFVFTHASLPVSLHPFFLYSFFLLGPVLGMESMDSWLLGKHSNYHWSTSLTFLSYLILSYFSHGSNHKENFFVFFTSVEAITYIELLSVSFNQKMLKCGIKFSQYRQLYKRNKLS